jgi:hypothetical protein
MKILFVGFNAEYINPTNQLIHRMLKLFAEVVFYGPGFVSDKELHRGVKAFYDQHGPFDFLATTSQLAADAIPKATESFYRRNALCPWDKPPVGLFMTDARKYMERSSVPKLVFVMDLDTHGVSQKTLDSLINFSDYIVAWGNGFSRKNSELTYLELESDYKRKARLVPLGLWNQFCEDYRARFLNLGHFVGLHEFDFSPLNARRYHVSVAGQLYYARKKALRDLRRSDRISVGSTGYRLAFSLADKLGFSPYSKLMSQTIYRLLFKNLLCTSQISMTDGAAYDMVIRKFFEIPAAGAVLLARPCAGFEALGFRDAESAIILNENDPVGQVLALLKSPDHLQSIANKGQELVWQHHSITARAQQMKSALDRIVSGSFKGSSWCAGRFILTD